VGDRWRNIGGVFPPGAPVTAVSRNPNQLDLFICGNDGRVYTSWWTGGSDWTGLGDTWRNIGGVFPAGAPVAAVSRNPNQLDLFICGNNGRVYTSWWTLGSDWTGVGDQWRNIGAPIGPPPVSIGPLGTGSITFDNGVPVGGSSQVTLWPDGSYVFEGHFHDSGFPSYNDGLVFVVKDNLTNTAYTFGHSGHMAGTTESGSRDDNFNVQSRSADLQGAWTNFGGGWNWHWEADVNADWNTTVDKALSAVGVVLGVVSIVQAAAAGGAAAG
jgi:hypothetical protein